MKKIVALINLLLFFLSSFAQRTEYKFGLLDREHLDMKVYSPDSSANSFVISEYGYSFISEGEGQGLIFEYYVKIKILNDKGINEANISIPLRKQDSNYFEKIYDIRAVSHTLDENNTYRKTELDRKNIYTEKKNNYLDVVKFAIPNVKVGTIIEYCYKVDSPFIYNFKKWNFQSTIPKKESVYWAKIPGNYNYNISLKGFYKLSDSKSELVKDCFKVGGGVADCGLYKYEMKNIPAFIEEEYMTSGENYLSSVNFELIEIKYFNGTTKKFTKTWQDIYNELKSNDDFGLQIKRNSDLFKNELKPIIETETDKEIVARKVYDIVKNWYKWNNYYGKYADLGLKKAYESRIGNIGDINLALIGALQYAKVDTEPVLVSTRDNGLPTRLFPVMSDFNYVIAKVNVNDKSYLLDASDKELDFGMLPYRCLNDQARAIGKDSCYWVSLKPTEKFKKWEYMNLELDSTGLIKGQVVKRYYGYDALSKRKLIKTYASENKYIDELRQKTPGIKILDFKISNLDSLAAPLVEELNIEIDAFDNLHGDKLSINPFFMGHMKENPFKLDERIYPVDFGAKTESNTVLNLKIPSNFKLDYASPAVALQLPKGSGHYICQVEMRNDNIISMYEKVVIDKPIYFSDEYQYLKELYNKIVQVNKTELIISKTAAK
ncbi:transglutaminase domain protein [Pseudopedobacter saltans DSM 12145]|uniref:Transglutaminase domain protein n=1 Tax=Pseudopedobacter saltans (strain ATCC 51119 / DSM 12145 / JCM 21818 / CCUG 39354 / LMG 10337 / NBRC 100064 / NCIMB 13643) TaxID=762903 RepID=F0SC54_PSESL|nr:DUF3857 domain-containing protein [Pseudopedobacter saltans]ADY50639.1 transglutaminase domain protein [Pseudopedobacter saltans DSM 12145]